MKQYVIDELRWDDYQKLKAYLLQNFDSPSIEGIFWIPLAEEDLSAVQQSHADCKPFYFIVALEPNHMACELLIRTKNRVRCNCIRYATPNQLKRIIRFADDIFAKLAIKT